MTWLRQTSLSGGRKLGEAADTFFRGVRNFMPKNFTIKAGNFFIITVRSSVISFITLITLDIICECGGGRLRGVCMHRRWRP